MHLATTLGITIDSRLSFQSHVDIRTGKAERILKAMKGLVTINGGMSQYAMGALYTGIVCPIFTWGAEVWLSNPTNFSAFRSLECQALRKITGAYYGASHLKLGLIANIEPIQDKLRNIVTCWAAKRIRMGDPHIRPFLQEPPLGCPQWHDGTGGPQSAFDTPITAAFHWSAISHPGEISWGDSTDHRQGNLHHITLLEPEDPGYKEKAYWAAMLAQLTEDQ